MNKTVSTASKELTYDYLVIATGYRNNFEIVPGLKPTDGNAVTITTLEDAIKAGEVWKKFLKDPGVIILTDKILPPRKHGVLIPGPQAHLLKIAFEKYFLCKARNGYVRLP